MFCFIDGDVCNVKLSWKTKRGGEILPPPPPGFFNPFLTKYDLYLNTKTSILYRTII